MTKITENEIELFAIELLEKLNMANMPYLKLEI
jgi:hypothetical protein